MATESKLMTAEELFARSSELGPCELLDGRLVQLMPPGARHNRIMGLITLFLLQFVMPRRLGEVLPGDAGVVLARNPDRVRGPNVCFISAERLPQGGVPIAYLDVVPDLIVELVSPNDTAAEVQSKAEEWLRAEARLVVTVYPQTHSIVASHSLDTAHIYHEDDTLTVEPVIPGFAVPVSALFS